MYGLFNKYIGFSIWEKKKKKRRNRILIKKNKNRKTWDICYVTQNCFLLYFTKFAIPLLVLCITRMENVGFHITLEVQHSFSTTMFFSQHMNTPFNWNAKTSLERWKNYLNLTLRKNSSLKSITNYQNKWKNNIIEVTD